MNFTKQMADTLTEGSDKLTLADLNEEGANLVALQTRQQINQSIMGITKNTNNILSLLSSGR